MDGMSLETVESIRKKVVDSSDLMIASNVIEWQGETDISEWKKKMYKPYEYVDEIFIQLFAEIFEKKVVLIPVHKSVGHNRTGRIEVIPSCGSVGHPMFFLYYSECKFQQPHYQSIRPLNGPIQGEYLFCNYSVNTGIQN